MRLCSSLSSPHCGSFAISVWDKVGSAEETGMDVLATILLRAAAAGKQTVKYQTYRRLWVVKCSSVDAGGTGN